MTHHFKLWINTPDKSYNAKPGHRLWHCKKCDTLILYPNRMSEIDVNVEVERSMLICLEAGKLN